MAKKAEEIDVAGRTVTVTNPDKVFFPQQGLTKRDLVRYYLAVAEGALRGAGGRPMALKRFVNGADGEAFFQKRAPENRPEWIETVWAGDTVTTDLAYDLHLPGGALPEAVDRLKAHLQDKGIIFRPW